MGRRVIDEEIKAKALEDIRNGMPYTAVARRYAISYGTVSLWAAVCGIRSKQAIRVELSRAIPDAEILRCLDTGMGTADIAKKFNIQLAAVTRRRKILGRANDYLRGKEWKLLSRNTRYLGRLLSIPAIYITEAGFDPKDDLYARVSVSLNSGLNIEIKKKSEVFKSE